MKFSIVSDIDLTCVHDNGDDGDGCSDDDGNRGSS